jgi:secondary thiamine-phosphate synthase enzyme
MIQFTVRTNSKFEMLDITGQLRDILSESKIKNGICHVFIPHTTAAVTINENADPDVPRDLITGLDRLVPLSGNYRHGEGNAAAHIKSSLIGVSKAVFIENSALILGAWQSIFFCEFDGPRSRKVFVKLIPTE